MESKPIHVTPINDLREHSTDHPCWCCPRIEKESRSEDNIIYGKLIVHNSADGREYLEELDPLLVDRNISQFLALVIESWVTRNAEESIAGDRAYQLAWAWLEVRESFYKRSNPEPEITAPSPRGMATADFLDLFIPRVEL